MQARYLSGSIPVGGFLSAISLHWREVRQKARPTDRRQTSDSKSMGTAEQERKVAGQSANSAVVDPNLVADMGFAWPHFAGVRSSDNLAGLSGHVRCSLSNIRRGIFLLACLSFWLQLQFARYPVGFRVLKNRRALSRPVFARLHPPRITQPRFQSLGIAAGRGRVHYRNQVA
jgi:hypothetical protein